MTMVMAQAARAETAAVPSVVPQVLAIVAAPVSADRGRPKSINAAPNGFVRLSTCTLLPVRMMFAKYGPTAALIVTLSSESVGVHEDAKAQPTHDFVGDIPSSRTVA